MLAQAEVRVRPRDTAETLAGQVLKEEHRLYPEALDRFAAAMRGGESGMSDPIETAEERREAAAIRRRWITLGEVLAVIGILISALAL